MSYLLDKKIKRNTFFKYLISIVVLFILVYFRAGIWNGLSYVSHAIFRPVLILGNNIGEKFSSVGSYFYSKKSLLLENESLKNELNEISNRVSNYNSILDENLKIKEILGRKNGKKNMVLSAILSKPNRSLYDTLIVDVGANSGVLVGDKVFALGNVPIGFIAEAYSNSSKVILYSNPGEKTEVVVTGTNTFMQITGRGGGNFEMILPRDFVLGKGTEVVLPGITSHTIATVQTIISDPRDSFQKALLISPVNIQELKFVQIEK